jgi:hypothetical protein
MTGRVHIGLQPSPQWVGSFDRPKIHRLEIANDGLRAINLQIRIDASSGKDGSAANIWL